MYNSDYFKGHTDLSENQCKGEKHADVSLGRMFMAAYSMTELSQFSH